MGIMEIEKSKEEIKEWIEENPLANALLKKSSLNSKELEALQLYFEREDTSFNDLASVLEINRSGAWKRWKKGYQKIMESFFTLELAVYGGILDPKATKFLIEDLQDYTKLVHQQGDKEAIKKRIEKRMAEMENSGL